MQIDMQHIMLATIHVTARPEGFELWIKSCYVSVFLLCRTSPIHDHNEIKPYDEVHILYPTIY